MLFFGRYFVVYSAIPQVIKVNCIDCICIYRCVLMCLCTCVTLADFFTFLNTNYADPVSVCVVLYVIILIQILFRYNVKNLITAGTRSLDFDLKIEKSPYPGRDPPPRPSPRFAPSHLSFFHSVPPPQCVDPRYATGPRKEKKTEPWNNGQKLWDVLLLSYLFHEVWLICFRMIHNGNSSNHASLSSIVFKIESQKPFCATFRYTSCRRRYAPRHLGSVFCALFGNGAV